MYMWGPVSMSLRSTLEPQSSMGRVPVADRSGLLLLLSGFAKSLVLFEPDAMCRNPKQ